MFLNCDSVNKEEESECACEQRRAVKVLVQLM